MSENHQNWNRNSSDSSTLFPLSSFLLRLRQTFSLPNVPHVIYRFLYGRQCFFGDFLNFSFVWTFLLSDSYFSFHILDENIFQNHLKSYSIMRRGIIVYSREMMESKAKKIQNFNFLLPWNNFGIKLRLFHWQEILQ